MQRKNRWLALFVSTRLIATAAGVTLVLLHDVTADPWAVAAVAAVYGVGTALAVIRWEDLHRSAVAWVLRIPLHEGGLAEAVRERAAELERASGVSIEVEGGAPQLPATVAAHTFRVLGEAMTNAVRHADADRIQVRLAGDDGLLAAEVSDDGRGIPAEPRPGSNGLRSMRARAEILGGTLSITARARPQGEAAERPGTSVRLEVPLESPRDRMAVATTPAGGGGR